MDKIFARHAERIKDALDFARVNILLDGSFCLADDLGDGSHVNVIAVVFVARGTQALDFFGGNVPFSGDFRAVNDMIFLDQLAQAGRVNV